jgi:D-xylose transport system substrate-binding protein
VCESIEGEGGEMKHRATLPRLRYWMAIAAGCATVFGATSAVPSSANSVKTVPGFAGTLPYYAGTGKVGFSIYNGAVPHWTQHDIPDMKKCLKTYAPGMSLVTADPKGNAQLQTTQVQSMLAQKIKVLLLTPAALTPTAIINQAKQAGVPVIDYVNPVEHIAKGDIVALIGDGPVPIGTEQGKWILAQHYPKGTQIALINGDLATQYAQLMRTAQLKVLKPAIASGALKVVTDKGAVNWDGANAQKLAAAMVVAHPDVKAIIAGADFLAGGVIEALKAAGKAGKVDIIGLDADPIGAQNMLLGTQKATVIKSSDNEAKIGCAAIIYTLAKQPLPKSIFNATWSEQTGAMPFRDTPVKVIEKGQLSQAIAWGILTKSDMCKGLPSSVGAPCS